MTDFEGAVLAAVPKGLFIGGEWVPAAPGKTFGVHDPATGLLLMRVADASPEDGLRALDAASIMSGQWAATPPRIRGEIRRGAFEHLQERKNETAMLMCRRI